MVRSSTKHQREEKSWGTRTKSEINLRDGEDQESRKIRGNAKKVIEKERDRKEAKIDLTKQT